MLVSTVYGGYSLEKIGGRMGVSPGIAGNQGFKPPGPQITINHRKTMGKPLENGNVMGINPDWFGVWNIFMTFHILGMIIPIDELIFFRGIETTNQPSCQKFTYLDKNSS